MLIQGQANYIRISPRKLMLIAEAVKNLSVDKAVSQLSLLNKNGSLEIRNVLLQAKANAVNNLKIKESDLKIKEIQIGTGPTLKRGRPVSRGMWHQIKKRTSHIKVILEDINTK